MHLLVRSLIQGMHVVDTYQSLVSGSPQCPFLEFANELIDIESSKKKSDGPW